MTLEWPVLACTPLCSRCGGMCLLFCLFSSSFIHSEEAFFVVGVGGVFRGDLPMELTLEWERGGRLACKWSPAAASPPRGETEGDKFPWVGVGFSWRREKGKVKPAGSRKMIPAPFSTLRVAHFPPHFFAVPFGSEDAHLHSTRFHPLLHSRYTDGMYTNSRRACMSSAQCTIPPTGGVPSEIFVSNPFRPLFQ